MTIKQECDCARCTARYPDLVSPLISLLFFARLGAPRLAPSLLRPEERQIRHGPSRLMFFPLMALACFYKDIHMLFFFFFPHPLNMLKSHLSTASPNLELAEARIMKLNEFGRFIYSRCVDLATLEVKCVYSSFPLIFGKPLAYHFRCFPPSLSCLFPLHLSICMKLGCLSSQGALIKKCGYEN